MRKSPSRRLAAFAAGALALAAGVTCTDAGLTGPSSLRAAVALVPSLSRAALEIYRNLASFEFAPDNIHVRLVRTNATVALDTVAALAPGQDSVVLDMTVTLEKSPEVFEAKIEIREGTQVLFAGTQTITAHAGTTAPIPPIIELDYTGPGADVVILDVNPDTTILVADSVAMRAVGRNASEQVVNDLALDWSLDDPTMGSVSGTGVFRPARRGTAIVTATLPTGVSGSATVNVVAPPTTLALVSGANQSGLVGSVLPQPIVVEVRASDNLPSAGISVSFAAIGGGSVNPTTTVTGANGRASTVLTLGPTAGTNTVRVTAGDLTPITVSATATTPQPTTRTWVGPASGIWETAANWSGGVVPAALDTVVLNGPADYIISVASAVTIAKLTLGTATGQQALIVSGPAGTLTVTDSVHVATSGLLLLGASSTETVLTSGPIVVDGIMELLNGGIAGSGNIDVSTNGSFLISGDAAMSLSNRVVRNAGLTFLAADIGSLQLHNGSRIENLASGEFMTQGEIDIVQGTGPAGSVRNDGLYQMITAGVGTHSVAVAFENNGTIEMFNGIMAFTGPSMVNSATGIMRGTGTLALTATTVQQSGIIEPGLSPGLLSFTGALPLQASSRMNIELGGTSAENGYDVVGVSGAVSFAGTLDVTLINGYTPVAGDSLTIVRYASRTGTFDTLVGLTLGGGMFLDPVYTATGLSLVVRQTAPAGASWINAAGGNWSVGANWSTGVAPGAGDVATIDLAGTYTVTLDVNPTIAGLTLGGAGSTPTLAGTSRTLTVNGSTTIAPTGAVNFVTSSFAGSGTISNAGTVTMQGGTVSATTSLVNSGLLRTHGAVSILGPLTTTSTSTIRPLGQTTGGTAALTVTNGFTNNGLIELTSTGGHASSLTVTNGTLTNSASGRIQTTTTGTRTLAVQLNNLGVLEVDNALTLNRASAVHSNSGTIDLTTADLTVTQTGTTPSFANTSTGVVTLGANRDWTVTGGTLDIDEGSVTGPLTARLLVTNAALAFTTANVGTLPLTLTTTTIVGGSVTVPNGQTLTLLNGEMVDPITVESGGTLLVHGAVNMNGALSLPTGSTLRLMGQTTGGTAALTLAPALTNNGTIELTSSGGHAATLTMATAVLTNAPGGVIRSLSTGTRTLAVQLDNQGLLEVDNALTMNRLASDHLNSGTIDLTTADLTVTQGGTTPTFTSTGTVMLGANRDWTVNGGTLDIGQGTVTGPLSARLVVSNASLAFTPANVGVLPLTLTTTSIVGGSVTIPNGQTLTLLNGGLSDPVTVESGGVLLVHGAVNLTGAVTLPTGSTLRLMGQTIGGTAALNVQTDVTNEGVIELTSSGGHAASITMTANTLQNAVGGVIRSLTTGTRTLAVQLANQGTLDVDNALTLGRANADLTNAGTIDLTDADLTVALTGASPTFANFVSGSVILGANRDWTVNGGTLDIDEGTVTGTASSRLLVSNSLLEFTPANLGSLPLTLTNTAINGGVVNIGTGETLVLLNGGLADPVNVLGGGTLLAHGAVSLSGGLTLATSSTLRLMGQTIGGTSALTVTTNVVNNGTIELTSSGGHAATLSMPTTTLTNSSGATIRSLTTGTRTLAVALDNQGTLEVDNALTINRAESDHLNTGTIDLTTADLTVTQSGTTPSFTNVGTITLGTNRDLTVTGGALNATQGALSGPASSRLIVTNVLMQMTTATVTLPLTITTSSLNGGSVTIPSGQTLTLLNANVSDAVTIQGGGTLLTHGASTVASLTMPTGSVLRLMGQTIGGTSNLSVTSSFTNNGTIEMTSTGGHGASLNMPGGTTLTNAPAGLIQTLTTGTRLLNVELANQGTIDLDNALQMNRPDVAHINSGVINLQDANLTLGLTGTPASFTNTSTGSVSLGANRDFTVNGGTLDIDQGAVTGTATSRLIVNNAAMQFTTGAVTLPLTLTNTSTGGTVNIPTGQTLTLLNGGLADGVAVNGGTLRVHGAVGLTGGLAVVAGTLEVNGQTVGGTAALTVANGLTNAGLIDLTSTGGHAATLAVTAGTLLNETGGVIAVNSTGTRTLAAQLDNRGTIDLQQDLTVNRAGSQHFNTGIINVAGGNLTVTQTGTTPSFLNASGAINISATRTATFSGGTFLNDGVGVVNGAGTLNVAATAFTNNAYVQPGGSGTAGNLTVQGPWAQVTPTGALNLELGGATPGTQHDRVTTTGTGTVTLDGMLNVTIINGFQPVNGSTFTILTGTQTRAGTFSQVSLPTLTGGLVWSPIQYNTNSIVLTVTLP